MANGLLFIGICGRPGAGKDTIGDYLRTRYGFSQITIKKPIEESVKAVLRVSDYNLYDRDGREQPLEDWPGWTVRKALQGFAQSLRDLVGEHVWIKSMCMRMDEESNMGNIPSQRVVVTDIRTPTDMSFVRDHVEAKGGRAIMIMVKRPGHGSTTAGGFANHKLESYDLEGECDAVFNNNGTIDELLAKVVRWLYDQEIKSSDYKMDKVDKVLFAAIEAAASTTPVRNPDYDHYDHDRLILNSLLIAIPGGKPLPDDANEPISRVVCPATANAHCSDVGCQHR